MADDVRVLVERSLRGDSSAVGELVGQFRDRVFGLCFRMLGHREDAEDAVQEAFVRAFRSLGRWDPTREFAPWLLTIAANRCRTMLALRTKRRASSSEVELLADERPDGIAARHLAEEVQLALESLRDDHRQAFLLFHTEHLSYVDIAAALDVPLGTVKTWVHRARLELAERLRRRGAVEGEPDALPRV